MIRLVLFFLFAIQIQAQVAQFIYPDIEQGASTLVISPTGKTVLIDAGSGMHDAEIPLEMFLNNLIETGVFQDLDMVIISHYDEDHIGRLAAVLRQVPLADDFVIYDRGEFGTLPSSFVFKNYLYEVKHHQRKTIEPGQIFDLGGGLTAETVVVNGKLANGEVIDLSTSKSYENATSIAMAFRFGTVDLWIGGDLVGRLPYNPEVEAAAGKYAGDMDIYTVNHHGSSATSSEEKFLNWIKPEVAICQNSSNNNFGHPASLAMKRILKTKTTRGGKPEIFQTNPGNPKSPLSDDGLATGISDGDDLRGYSGYPGPIYLWTDGQSYQLYGSYFEPKKYLADEGTPQMGAYPPALMRSVHQPHVPNAGETVFVSAVIANLENQQVMLDWWLDKQLQAPIEMTSSDAKHFQGQIPGQPDATLVEYRVRIKGHPFGYGLKNGFFSGVTRLAKVKESNEVGYLKAANYPARIEGVITAEFGLFHKHVSQLYLQDAHAGINIFHPEPFEAPRGTKIRCTGKISQFAGNSQLIAVGHDDYGIEILTGGEIPAAEIVSFDQIDETNEGRLLRLENVRVKEGQIPLSKTDTLVLVDEQQRTISMRIDGDTDILGANTPRSSFSVSGILVQFDPVPPLDSGYYIVPREKADFDTSEVNHSEVLINEIFASPSGPGADANGDGVVHARQDEFIEIINVSGSPQDISGWRLADRKKERFVFPQGTILPGREVALVFGGGNPVGAFGNTSKNKLVFTASLSLNNSGDDVILRNAQGEQVQKVCYGSEGKKPTSMVRFPEWSNGAMIAHKDGKTPYSPGTRLNGDAFTLAAGQVVISEVCYNPKSKDDGAEWIELYNTTDQAIDLKGLSLAAAGKSYQSFMVDLEGVIPPKGTFVIGGPKSSELNGEPKFDMTVNFGKDLPNGRSATAAIALFCLASGRVSEHCLPIDVVFYGHQNNKHQLRQVDGSLGMSVGSVADGGSIELTRSGSWRIQMKPTPNKVPMQE